MSEEVGENNKSISKQQDQAAHLSGEVCYLDLWQGGEGMAMLLDFDFEGRIYMDKQRHEMEAFQAESRPKCSFMPSEFLENFIPMTYLSQVP